MTTDVGTVGRSLRWVLAALSAAAAGIHFGAVGEHFDVGWPHGTFFAVVAWLQVAWTVGIVLRPTRRLLVVGALLNAAVISVWAISRVWGVPIDPDAWTPEPVGFADALATGFEAGIVLCSLAVLVRPGISRKPLRAAFGVPGVAVTVSAITVGSVLAFTPTFASSHTHRGESTGAIADTPCGKSGPPAFEGQNTGTHDHRGPAPWQPIRDATVRTELAAQIEQARDAAASLPTVGAAVAAGYRELTPYLPCIGAHYVNDLLFASAEFDASRPAILIYDGTQPASKIVGLSYVVQSDQTPVGFAGPNDLWHAHSRLCVSRSTRVVVGSERTSDRRCAALGGQQIDLHQAWMMHAWVVPGWESPWGIFSAEHPELGGKGRGLAV